MGVSYYLKPLGNGHYHGICPKTNKKIQCHGRCNTCGRTWIIRHKAPKGKLREYCIKDLYFLRCDGQCGLCKGPKPTLLVKP